VGGFNPTLRVAEDYDLYLRIARALPICCHAAIVAEYRKHEANVSHNSELMLTTTLQVLKDQERYLRNDSGRIIAFHEGVRSWRKQYGRQLASELARSYSTLPTDHLLRKLRRLAGSNRPAQSYGTLPPGSAGFSGGPRRRYTAKEESKSTSRRTSRSEARLRRQHGALTVCAPSSTRRR
jgi:hypothetical protein